MIILRLLGSSDDKEKIGAARPEGPPLRGFRWNLFGPKDKNRRDCEEIQYTGWTDVKEKTYAGVIVQKLETEDTLTGLTDVEENAYVGALPDEDQEKYIHRLIRCITGLLTFTNAPDLYTASARFVVAFPLEYSLKVYQSVDRQWTY